MRRPERVSSVCPWRHTLRKEHGKSCQGREASWRGSSVSNPRLADQQRSKLSPVASRLSSRVAWGGANGSEPEFANACLIEAKVVTNLVPHRLGDVRP